MSGWDEIKRQITESQVWQSIFRHGYDDTPRNRILMVSGNVWRTLEGWRWSHTFPDTMRMRFRGVSS